MILLHSIRSCLESIIRLVTLELAIQFLVKLVYNAEAKVSFLSAEHLSRLERTFEETRENLRRYDKVNFSLRNELPLIRKF